VPYGSSPKTRTLLRVLLFRHCPVSAGATLVTMLHAAFLARPMLPNPSLQRTFYGLRLSHAAGLKRYAAKGRAPGKRQRGP
jgi:hypothetical protein